MDNLKFSVDLTKTVEKTDLVLEAIVENIGVKHKLFSSIDAVFFILNKICTFWWFLLLWPVVLITFTF